jgi:hypothetical protein
LPVELPLEQSFNKEDNIQENNVLEEVLVIKTKSDLQRIKELISAAEQQEKQETHWLLSPGFSDLAPECRKNAEIYRKEAAKIAQKAHIKIIEEVEK